MEALLAAPRRTGQQTREAILVVAAGAFRDMGFDVATLEEIAARLGITRPAVLHHFRTKHDLLHEIVVPVMARLDALIDRFAATGEPLTPRQQRIFLSEIVDFACDNRAVTALLVRDITAHRHLSPTLQISDRVARFTEIVSHRHDHPEAGIAVLAAVGAIMRPVSAPETVVDLSSPASRRVLVDAAVAALRAGLQTAAVEERTAI